MTEEDSSSPEDPFIPEEHKATLVSLRRPPRYLAACLLLSVCLATVLILINPLAKQCTCHASEKPCTTLSSGYSPALEAVEYEWVKWPNQFRQPSPYRGQPDREVELAWQNLTMSMYFSFPREKLAEIRKDKERGSEEWVAAGGGISATLEAIHQLHCLDLIRKYTYQDVWDYSAEPEWAAGPTMLRHHVDHCIEILRVALSCFGDTTPILIYRDPEAPLGGSPDFETWHQCRKLDGILDWSRNHLIED